MIAAVLACFATAFAIPAVSASPDIETFPGVFDGSPVAVGAVSMRQALGRQASFPPVDAEPVDAPLDLRKARERWGTRAELRKLYEGNPLPHGRFAVAIIGDAEPGRLAVERMFPPYDNHIYEKQLRQVQAKSPEFILQLGDFVSIGTEENYRKYLDLLDKQLKAPIFHVLGNHDRSRPNGPSNDALYGGVMGRPDYFFDYNGWRIVALDTSQRERGLTRDQLDWLDQVLDTPLHKIVMTHVPPAYLKGKLNPYSYVAPSSADYMLDFSPDDGDFKDQSYLGDFFTNFFENGSERFREIVARRRVDRVYMGHIHAFGLAVVDGVHYVLSGGGGSRLYNPLPPGYPKRKLIHFIWAELGPDGIRETMYEYAGENRPPIAHSMPEILPAAVPSIAVAANAATSVTR